MDKVQAVLLSDSEDCPRRVKVAVLDTGFSRERSKAPWDIDPEKYKDFVDGKDHVQRDESESAHGTTLVKLVDHVLPDAEIYVARVFRDGTLTNETAERVEKVRTPHGTVLD
jgi:hypothetical protein